MEATGSAVAIEPSVSVDRFTSAGTWARAGTPWESHEERTLVCCRIADETHDVRTFVFSAEDGLPFNFEPGQFLTVLVEIDGQALTRCYTISSPPTRPYTLSITVKRVPGGVVSNWLHDNMQISKTLRAFGPAGSFTPVAHPSTKALYLSAGSGVTPLMAMTRAAFDLGLDRDIVFIHSARTPGDIIFRDELSSLVAEAENFRVIHICEDAGGQEDWSGPTGRLTLEILQRNVPDYREREVFTCGPGGYMQAAKDILRDAGHEPSRHHQESFNISAEISDATTQASAASKGATGSQTSTTYTLHLAKSGKSLAIDASQTILTAVKKAGIAVASSCSQGICGTCKTKVLEGEVDMRHNGGIRQREIDKGMRLLCCSRPTSDLVLDL